MRSSTHYVAPDDPPEPTEDDLFLFAAAEHASRSRLFRHYKNVGIVGCIKTVAVLMFGVWIVSLGYIDSPTIGAIFLGNIAGLFLLGWILFALTRHKPARPLLQTARVLQRCTILCVLIFAVSRGKPHQDWLLHVVLGLLYFNVGYWVALTTDWRMLLSSGTPRWWKIGSGGYNFKAD